MISFFVPGVPIPQPRPQVARRGPVSHVYYPNKKVGPWKEAIRSHALGQGMNAWAAGIPLQLDLEFCMPHPKNHLRANGEVKDWVGLWHSKRPDIDNLTKAVMDALEPIVWEADASVAKLVASKAYSLRPGCFIKAYELDWREQ